MILNRSKKDLCIIAAARELYCLCSDDNIEVDDNAHFSPTDEGTWVSAWLWVPHPKGEDCSNKGAAT